MAYDYVRRRASAEKSGTPAAGKSPARSVPDMPNSAMLSMYGQAGPEASPDLASAMQEKFAALTGSDASAEAEADRLSAGVTAKTPEGLRLEMGRRMGADFSGVRFHSDAGSEAKAGRMGARAWAQGGDVYFGEGGFDPAVAAHELVHTVQQGAVAGSASVQSVPMGTVQMWGKSKKEKQEQKDREQREREAAAELTLNRLFKIRAGLNSGDNDLVTEEDKAWYEATMKNGLNAEIVRAMLRRRDEAGVKLADLRRDMDKKKEYKKTGKISRDYLSRGSNEAFDMSVYDQLLRRGLSSTGAKLTAYDFNRQRNKRVAAKVDEAYALLKGPDVSGMSAKQKKEYDAIRSKNSAAFAEDFKKRSKMFYGEKYTYKDRKTGAEHQSRYEGIDMEHHAPTALNDWVLIDGFGDETERVNIPEYDPTGKKYESGPVEFTQRKPMKTFFGVTSGSKENQKGAWGNWYKSMSSDEKTSMVNYTTEHEPGNYHEVNNSLRGSRQMDQGTQKHIDNMEKSINKFNLEKDMTVFRGSSAQLIGGLTEPADIMKYLGGRSIRDKGFISTSTVKGSQFGGEILYKIRIPKGHGRGALISPLSKYQSEDEMLLQHGSSFTVVNATKQDVPLRNDPSKTKRTTVVELVLNV